MIALDLPGLLTLLSSTIAASTGAYVSARFGTLQREQADSARLRRATAEELIESLLDVRRLLRSAATSRDVREWTAAVEACFDNIDNARHRLPKSFRHLKFSVRGAIGEAVGAVAFADLTRSSDDYVELGEYDHKWSEFAIEYIEAATDSIRRWRDSKSSVADKLSLRGYDDWLAATGRYTQSA
jgi:hypothetical protein